MTSPFDILDRKPGSNRPQTAREPTKSGQGTAIIFPPGWREKWGHSRPKRGETKGRFLIHGLEASDVEEEDRENYVPPPNGRVHLGFSEGLRAVTKKFPPKDKEAQSKPSPARKPKKTWAYPTTCSQHPPVRVFSL